MADTVGAKICSGSVGAAGESASLTSKVNQVRVTNYHATQVLWAVVYTGATAAAALTLADATDAVAAADETYIIPAGTKKVIFKSPRSAFIALAVIGSGAATTYVVEGTDFFTDN